MMFNVVLSFNFPGASKLVYKVVHDVQLGIKLKFPWSF